MSFPKRTPENTFKENNRVTQSTLRRMFLEGNYSKYECSICGIGPTWNGKDLSLTLDHIDGNRTNNKISNLRWVCPNCDRQLPTFGSKNKHHVKKIYYCPICRSQIHKGARYCKKCKKEEYIKSISGGDTKQLIDIDGNIWDEVKLSEEIKEHGVKKVAKIYFNITDAGLRKRLKAVGLKYKTRDYDDKFINKDRLEKENVIQMVMQGNPYRIIAEKCGVTYYQIFDYCRKNGIDIKKINTRRIVMSGNGGVEKTFHSINDAAKYIANERQTKNNFTIYNKIRECIRQKRKSAYGYTWTEKHN